ncbi:NAD(P)-dependent oxidoreductase [Candidatus Acetothermia bacterium]|nr:MAG: NAD(P)-dependent oxidoreductase [Candidatus Acetothermia bacterium]
MDGSLLLEGKTVLVTGAGQGIGRGIARAIAEAGGNVALLDLKPDTMEETARLVGEEGGKAVPFVADVTDEVAVRHAIDRTIEAFGRLDGLVNNAGVIKMESALETTAADWDLHFAVNVRGMFTCCRLAGERMIEQGGGSIVNVASNAGKVGYPNMAAYNASKAAVISLTRTLAAEWAEHRINVNAVCPGGVDTPMLFAVAEWVAEKFGGEPAGIYESMKPHQMDRHVRPIEVGRVVAFLLSSHAEIIRGQSINVDGGDTPY